MSDISLETTRVRVRPREEKRQMVFFSFITDGVVEEANETLTLQLVPTPATLQTIPIGEGVFFKHESQLTIMDSDGRLIAKGYKNNKGGYPYLLKLQKVASFHQYNIVFY